MTYQKARFRWAVCQIDSLQRLKCDRRTIQKALKNLPKTLYEMYDRIFLSVPEEERLFVDHALRWIAHHNELYGQDIPCEVLIQAAEASMLSVTGNQNERFYDRDTLREVCGCLIDILPKDFYVVEITDRKYMSVSFAHYSVREYLDSNRTSNANLGYRAIGGEDLKDCFLEITLSQAQHVEPNDLWNSGPDPTYTIKIDVFEAVCSRFDIYCVESALASFLKFPSQICRNSRLSTLAIDLLDPSLPHFPTWEAAACTIMSAIYWFETNVLHNGAFSWGVTWHPDTNTKLKHLHSLLLLSECRSEYLTLAKKFLQGKDLKSLLQAQLCFKKKVLYIYVPPDNHKQIYSFEGSLIEVHAQSAPDSADVFRFLIEIGAGLFDPSTTLLSYTGSHDHRYCKSSCLMQRLLELGADPNVRGYRITPLQIATFYEDVEGVEMLLKAGAMPNDTGCPDGIVWPKGSVMHGLNILHGASPLRICKDFPKLLRPIYPEEKPHVREEIKTLLLTYGAEAFSTTSALELQELRKMYLICRGFEYG